MLNLRPLPPPYAIEIIWPTVTRLSSHRLKTWFDDAIANGDIPADAPHSTDYQMARALHDAGLITLKA